MFKVIKWFLYYLLIQFSLMFLFSFYYISKGYDSNTVSLYMNDNRVYLALLLGVIFIPLLFFEYKKMNIEEEPLKNIFLLILLGSSLSLIYNVFGFYIDKMLGGNLYGMLDIKTTLITTVLIGPIIEEYLFRGIIYNEAKKKYFNKAIFITTLFFALAHLNIIQFIYAIIIGYILIKVYEKNKNIKSCIIVHMFSNLVTTFITLVLIKDNLLLNILIFFIGFILLLFIKNKKYDII